MISYSGVRRAFRIYWFISWMIPLSVAAAPIEDRPGAIAETTGALSPERAVTQALSGNAGLAVMQSRASALTEVPAQVGTLPDPTVTLGMLSVPTDSFSLSQEAMTQTQIGLGWTLPYPGKLGLREKVAVLEAETASSDLAEKRLVIAMNVRQLWWNLFYLDRALQVVKQNQDLLRQFVKIAETRYKTGGGMQSDVLLAQVELSKLLEAEIALGSTRRGQEAALNAQLGRGANHAVVLSEIVSEPLPVLPEAEKLTKVALENRPLMVSRRALVAAASARSELAARDYYPDMRLGATYGFRRNTPSGGTRADLASVTLSLNIPLFAGSRQDKAVNQRSFEEQKEKYGLQDAMLQIESEIAQAVADYRAASNQALLFKSGIIPQAGQTAAAMLSAYQVNRVDFLNLVRSQVTLYNYQLQYWKSISAGWQAWARIESAIGIPLEQLTKSIDMQAMHGKENSHE